MPFKFTQYYAKWYTDARLAAEVTPAHCAAHVLCSPPTITYAPTALPFNSQYCFMNAYRNHSAMACNPYFTSLPDGTGRRQLRVGDMLWCPGAQDIGLSNRKLKSVLKCTVWSQCTPVPYGQTQSDRRTNEHHRNSATICYNKLVARYKDRVVRHNLSRSFIPWHLLLLLVIHTHVISPNSADENMSRPLDVDPGR